MREFKDLLIYDNLAQTMFTQSKMIAYNHIEQIVAFFSMINKKLENKIRFNIEMRSIFEIKDNGSQRLLVASFDGVRCEKSLHSSSAFCDFMERIYELNPQEFEFELNEIRFLFNRWLALDDTGCDKLIKFNVNEFQLQFSAELQGRIYKYSSCSQVNN